MSDPSGSKSIDDVINEVVADNVWGIEKNGEWEFVTDRFDPSMKDLIDYYEFAKKKHPKNKKERQKMTTSFTSKGQPGER